MDSHQYATRYPQLLPHPLSASTLDRPPWIDHFRSQIPSFTEVRELLPSRLHSLPDFGPAQGTSGRPAAVLIPLIDHHGEPGLLFTQRSWHLRRHKGEISFPGGGVEPGETYTQAAVRETFEEIGIPQGSIELLGSLGEAHTVSGGSTFWRIVGIVSDHRQAHESDEVARLLFVSLSTLLSSDVYHAESWEFTPTRHHVMHFFELEHDLLWGATARMVIDLCCAIAGLEDRPLKL